MTEVSTVKQTAPSFWIETDPRLVDPLFELFSATFFDAKVNRLAPLRKGLPPPDPGQIAASGLVVTGGLPGAVQLMRPILNYIRSTPAAYPSRRPVARTVLHYRLRDADREESLDLTSESDDVVIAALQQLYGTEH
jgi:hypothetical protein